MSESDYEPPEADSSQLNRTTEAGPADGQPGTGLVATDECSESVASSILRAQRDGHRVFVTYDEERENEGLRFARQLGATVVAPPRDGEPDIEAYRQRLAGAAEVSDCDGLIFVREPERRVDFERSVSRLEESTVCDAVYETEHDETRTAGITIGIPAYNEAGTIASVVTEARGFADTILVVDDGSDDDTSELASEAGATVVEHERNQGYGAALQTLFAEARDRDVAHLAIIDADGQHDPSDVPEMVQTQRTDGVDLVIGSRFTDDGETDAPLYRRFGLGVVNVLTNLSMGVIRPSSTVSDTQCGFRVYNSTAIASLADNTSIGEGMSASTDILYHAHSNNFAIEEVGTTVSYDVENASNRNPFAHGMKLVSNILKTVEKERPILLLGMPGILSLAVSLGFSYLTITNYIQTSEFSRSLGLLAATFGLAGTFAVFTALVLHALKQYFD